MTLIGERVKPRGSANAWSEAGVVPGPEGSRLRVAQYKNGEARCADVEEAVPVRPGLENGSVTKRRLVRLEGPLSYELAGAWMAGFVAARQLVPIKPQARSARRKPVAE